MNILLSRYIKLKNIRDIKEKHVSNLIQYTEYFFTSSIKPTQFNFFIISFINEKLTGNGIDKTNDSEKSLYQIDFNSIKQNCYYDEINNIWNLQNK